MRLQMIHPNRAAPWIGRTAIVSESASDNSATGANAGSENGGSNLPGTLRSLRDVPSRVGTTSLSSRSKPRSFSRPVNQPGLSDTWRGRTALR